LRLGLDLPGALNELAFARFQGGKNFGVDDDGVGIGAALGVGDDGAGQAGTASQLGEIPAEPLSATS